MADVDTNDLKKIWTVEKKKDNTYCLTKYKGKESKVVIPGYIGKTMVTEIGPNCLNLFNDDTIEELDIDENISIINCISGLKKLKKIIFHKQPKKILKISVNGEVFEDFGILGNVLYSENKLIAVSKNIDSDFVVEDGTVEIADYAFAHNKIIKNVKLPKSVKVINNSAFYSCINLENINLENVEKIGDMAFSSCDNLKEVNLKSLNEIGYSSFTLTGIEKLELPGIEIITREAFSNCSGLTDLEIDEGTTTIDYSAFQDCSNLKNVHLPKSLKVINDSAFIGCPNIEKINLAEDVQTFQFTFSDSVYEKIRPSNTEECNYDIERLLNETKNMSKNEIEQYVKDLLKDHKLDNFDTSGITEMNVIGFDKYTGQLSWNCPRCGYCTSDLYDLLANNGEMIDAFDMSGCGYCK